MKGKLCWLVRKYKLNCRKQPLLATWTTGESKYMNLALNLALSVRRNAPHLERTEKFGDELMPHIHYDFYLYLYLYVTVLVF